MIAWRRGCVLGITRDEPEIQEIEVACDGGREMAWNLPLLTGRAAPGDEVCLNATAASIGLGSGGYDFVLANLTRMPPGPWAVVPGVPGATGAPGAFGAGAAGGAAGADCGISAAPGAAGDESAEPGSAGSGDVGSGAARALSRGGRGRGHIMKLRYTPLQLQVLAVEEEASPHHRVMAEAESLEGTPVLVGTLHSQLAPAAAGCWSEGGGPRIAYVMTDGAALPIALSRTVYRLKGEGLLAGTVTVGHAFGGDLEAVNVYSGLIAARQVLKADLIIVTMGPGIVGTGTRWGTTALEQGEVLNAAGILGGRAVAIPRVSFADPRDRHHGVSHQTQTVLGRVALLPCIVACPVLPGLQWEAVKAQLAGCGALDRHRLMVRDGSPAMRFLEQRAMPVSSMGRGYGDDPALFLAAGAAGIVGRELLAGLPGQPED